MSNPDQADKTPLGYMPIKIEPLLTASSTPVDESDAQLFNVNGHIARRLIDLQLHKVDLSFVMDCLRLLTHQHVTYTTESEAIWIAAMVRFFKCFGSAGTGGRSQLSAQRVFKAEPAAAMVSFDNLVTLRNKTVVHDENSFMQGKLGVPIAFPLTGKPRMGPLVHLSFVATTLDDESVSNLTLLTQCALKWIDAEYAEKENLLFDQMKQEKVETLTAGGRLVWTSPSHETAGQSKSTDALSPKKTQSKKASKPKS